MERRISVQRGEMRAACVLFLRFSEGARRRDALGAVKGARDTEMGQRAIRAFGETRKRSDCVMRDMRSSRRKLTALADSF